MPQKTTASKTEFPHLAARRLTRLVLIALCAASLGGCQDHRSVEEPYNTTNADVLSDALTDTTTSPDARLTPPDSSTRPDATGEDADTRLTTPRMDIDAAPDVTPDVGEGQCPAVAVECSEACVAMQGRRFEPALSCLEPNPEIISCAGESGGEPVIICLERVDNGEFFVLYTSAPSLLESGAWVMCDEATASLALSVSSCDCPDGFFFAAGACHRDCNHDSECGPGESCQETCDDSCAQNEYPNVCCERYCVEESPTPGYSCESAGGVCGAEQGCPEGFIASSAGEGLWSCDCCLPDACQALHGEVLCEDAPDCAWLPRSCTPGWCPAPNQGVCVSSDDTEQTRCEGTGGTWVENSCGHLDCGVPSPDPCIDPGCDCGPFARFDPVEGCRPDPACLALNVVALCETTGGAWDENGCLHTVCGEWLNDCDGPAPGCNCGEQGRFVEEEGCVPDPVLCAE